MKTLICNCNQTLPLDAPALKRALARTPGASIEGLDTTHTLLCRREAAFFQRAAKDTTASGDELLVACTQESRLFLELNQETEGAAGVQERPIHFVNIRETAGWSQQGALATPKIAALLAAAQLPPPDPVPTVAYRSQGRCLVIGPAEAAERAASLLGDKLEVSVLLAGPGALAQAHTMAVHSGRLKRLSGWLGQFEAEWESQNPIDLDLCTRCNACIDICPEGAIGMDYQVDLDACQASTATAYAFATLPAPSTSVASRWPTVKTFDLVLDLRGSPAFSRHQLPQGYFHPASDERALHDAVRELREMTGEFDKPRFFRYDAKICAPTAATRRSAAMPASRSVRPRPFAATHRARARPGSRPPAASWSTRICACRLRRLFHRLPQRCNGLCLSRHGGSGPPPAHHAHGLPTRRRAQRGAADPQ
jgi:ferredoxin